MADGVQFDLSSSQKIAKATRTVLGAPGDRTGSPRFSYSGEAEFYAIIRGMDPSGRYSFHRVQPLPDQLHPGTDSRCRSTV